MGDIGFAELLVIIIVGVLCFGKDLPIVARKAAKWVGKARRYLLDVKEEVQRQIPLDDFDISRDIKRTIDEETYKPALSEPPPGGRVEGPEPAPALPAPPADAAPPAPGVETCPICGEGLKEPIFKCPKCSKAHHQGCWNYSGSCGIAECGGKATLSDPAVPGPPP